MGSSKGRELAFSGGNCLESCINKYIGLEIPVIVSIEATFIVQTIQVGHHQQQQTHKTVEVSVLS